MKKNIYEIENLLVLIVDNVVHKPASLQAVQV